MHLSGIDVPVVQLQTPESEADIRTGEEVALRCHLEASGEVHVEWFR